MSERGHLRPDDDDWRATPLRLYEDDPDDGIQLPAQAAAVVGSICWCGEEIEPGANHFMCYPGME